MQGNMTTIEYFTKYNALWEQLNAMRPLPVCECVPRYSCTLLSKIQKEREDDQVIRFLEEFNDEFETIKFGVLVMDPVPAMEKVLNMALKLERKLNGIINKSSELIQLILCKTLKLSLLMSKVLWQSQPQIKGEKCS